jgi:Tfp pilus assembly protein PilX
MRRRTRPRVRGERGYVLMIVLILLVVLTAAGVYGLRASQADIRQGGVARRLELTTNAAEVGATARMAEVMAASEDAGAALRNNSNVEAGGWTNYAGAAPTDPIYQNALDVNAQFLVSAEPLVAVGANPPAGIQIGAGGQLTLWQIDSFAMTRATAASDGAAQRVSVGVSVWSRGGLSYNSN